MRGGKIRIGLNYFNTKQEIDDFLVNSRTV